MKPQHEVLRLCLPRSNRQTQLDLVARQISVLAPLCFIVAHLSKIDFDSLPTAALVFRAYGGGGGELNEYKAMLKLTSKILTTYNGLSKREKRKILNSWLLSREKKHRELSKELFGKGTAGYDEKDLNTWDISKLDVILMSEGAPAIFYQSEDILRTLFNAKKTKTNPFTIESQIENWPAGLKKEIGVMGYIGYLDHFSFEGQKARQAPRVYKWLRSGMKYNELPALSKKQFD